jgi:hypothetical protein
MVPPISFTFMLWIYTLIILSQIHLFSKCQKKGC